MAQRRLLYGLLAALAFWITSSVWIPVPAQQPSPSPSPSPTAPNSGSSSAIARSPLIVGVSQAPPFAIKSGNDWDGVGVHLWREVARNLNLEYRLQELQPEEAVQQVQNGNVDLVITAIATAADEQQVDFTHSYYTSSLGIAERRQRGLLAIVQAVLSPQFLKITLWLSLLFVVIGIVVWAFERNHNDQFEKSPVRGIWTGFWWAGVTMSTIGYGDKTPKTVPGRILALLWMLVAMGITASLTASITSVLAVDSPLQAAQFPQDLWQLKVGSVPTSESAEYLQQERIQFQPYSTPLEGLRAVEQGDVDLFVYSAAPLRYLNRDSLNGRLNVQATDNQARRYAFALPANHALYEVINQNVLRETDESDWRSLLKRYMPEQSNS